jgi:hypothetical protein
MSIKLIFLIKSHDGLLLEDVRADFVTIGADSLPNAAGVEDHDRAQGGDRVRHFIGFPGTRNLIIF